MSSPHQNRTSYVKKLTSYILYENPILEKSYISYLHLKILYIPLTLKKIISYTLHGRTYIMHLISHMVRIGKGVVKDWYRWEKVIYQ